MVKTTIRFEDEVYRSARHAAIDEGITFQEFVERAVKEYLKKSPKDRKKEGKK